MSEASKKVANYPSSFEKVNTFTQELSSLNIKDLKGAVIPPKVCPEYQKNGMGGVPLYYDKVSGKVFMDNSDKHTLIIGSTGSKKSRLVAIPSVRLLAKAKESIIICDPKAEIYKNNIHFLTDLNYNVKVLNLRNPSLGTAWNPLSIPFNLYKQGRLDEAYEFVNDIAMNIASMDQFQEDPFWDLSAGNFLFGLILLLFKYCQEFKVNEKYVNIGNVYRLRNTLCRGSNGSDIDPILWDYAKKDTFIESALVGTVSTADRTRGGILSTFDQKMRIFSIQPSLLAMLSFNNIDYKQMLDRPTALFLILPDEKTSFHKLVSLFVKQSYEVLINEAQVRYEKSSEHSIRINYVLDEFSSLPTISDFPAMITASRSRNIRFNLFLQSKHQLILRYGEEANTIMDNCENWIFLTSRELNFLTEISELCGYISAESRKKLLSVTELQRLDKEKGEALLLAGRKRPFLTNLADISEYADRLGVPMKKEYDNERKWVPLDMEEMKKNIVMRKIANDPQGGEGIGDYLS